KIQSRIEFRGETTFSIQPEDLHEVAKFCRDELSFDYLIDISSIDNFGDEPRFEVVYELYSMTLAVYLRLKLAVSEEVCAVDTVSLELLLVSPVGEAEILFGRLRGLWGQFFPSFAILLGIWMYFSALFSSPDDNAISFYGMSFFTIPVIGLY